MASTKRKSALLAFLMLFSASLFARKVQIPAIRVEKGPVLDGYLTDPVWQKSAPYSNFRMVEPDPDANPSVRTELRVLYDHDDLFLGIHCYDPEPSRIASNSMAHDSADSGSRDDDLIRILLDPFQDRRNAYLFIVNPSGARSEGLALGERDNMDWDGIWDARSRRLPDGWSTEIRIPFKTLSFNPDLAGWGINVERYVPRKMEKIRLSGFTPDRFFNNPAEAALLTGIRHIRQGRGITIRPYGILKGVHEYPGEGQRQYSLDGGLDIYKNFTPNLEGAFSVNTDFAETEADERQINLTRFPLYFPEKRTFFLEGSELFNFGRGDSNFIPFYSRRIGLVNGRVVPITFGARVFGKMGQTSLTLLDVRTGETPDRELAGRNLFAGRIYQNIWEQSKVGIIFSSGSPEGNGRNSLAGIDFTYSTSRFQGDKNFLAGGWYVYNWNTIKSGAHYGYSLWMDYPNDLWDVSVKYACYGESLSPGLGYISRPGVKSLDLYAAFQPRPKSGLIGRTVRQFFFEFSPSIYWDMDGSVQNWELFTAPVNLRTQRGEHVEFNVIPNYDVLPWDFEIARGVVLPAGAYHFLNYRFEYSSPAYHPLVFDLSYRFGRFYSGTYRDATIGLRFRMKSHVNLSLDLNLVRGRLEQGTFSENAYQLKADFYFSPRLGLMNYIQYDDVSKSLGANIRFRWEITPGNQIYLVFTKNWERKWDPASRFVPTAERLVFKIQFNWRP